MTFACMELASFVQWEGDIGAHSFVERGKASTLIFYLPVPIAHGATQGESLLTSAHPEQGSRNVTLWQTLICWWIIHIQPGSLWSLVQKGKSQHNWYFTLCWLIVAVAYYATPSEPLLLSALPKQDNRNIILWQTCICWWIICIWPGSI